LKMVSKDSPALLVFSSGTGDAPPKPMIYSVKDLETMKSGVKRIYDICKSSGVFYNLIPFAPHMAIYFANYYGEVSGSLMVNTGGGKHFTTEKTIGLMKNIVPEIIAGMPSYILKVLEEAKKSGVNLTKVMHVWGANGINDDFITKIKGFCPNAEILATYGFTEARCAWTTCKDKEQGYHVFPESGRFESDENTGELIFFSDHYPDGFKTGDKGEILEGDKCPNCGMKCQRIGFKITRLDGKVKNYDL